MIEELKFNQNWNNKLNCKAFTSIRLSGRFQIGQNVLIVAPKMESFSVTVVGKKQLFLRQINDFIAYVDTGYDAEECKHILQTMYKNKSVDWNTQNIYFYLFLRNKE